MRFDSNIDGGIETGPNTSFESCAFSAIATSPKKSRRAVELKINQCLKIKEKKKWLEVNDLIDTGIRGLGEIRSTRMGIIGNVAKK